MITSISQAVVRLPMIAQEGGAEPGEGLTAIQTFTYFFAAPVAIFTVIALISWFASAPRGDAKNGGNQDDSQGDFILTIS